MEFIKSIIIKKAISNNFWSKILLAMIYILNLLSTSLLNKLNFYKTSTKLSL